MMIHELIMIMMYRCGHVREWGLRGGGAAHPSRVVTRGVVCRTGTTTTTKAAIRRFSD